MRITKSIRCVVAPSYAGIQGISTFSNFFFPVRHLIEGHNNQISWTSSGTIVTALISLMAGCVDAYLVWCFQSQVILGRKDDNKGDRRRYAKGLEIIFLAFVTAKEIFQNLFLLMAVKGYIFQCQNTEETASLYGFSLLEGLLMAMATLFTDSLFNLTNETFESVKKIVGGEPSETYLGKFIFYISESTICREFIHFFGPMCHGLSHLIELILFLSPQWIRHISILAACGLGSSLLIVTLVVILTAVLFEGETTENNYSLVNEAMRNLMPKKRTYSQVLDILIILILPIVHSASTLIGPHNFLKYVTDDDLLNWIITGGLAVTAALGTWLSDVKQSLEQLADRRRQPNFFQVNVSTNAVVGQDEEANLANGVAVVVNEDIGSTDGQDTESVCTQNSCSN